MASPLSQIDYAPISQVIAQLRCCTQVDIQNSWLGSLAGEQGGQGR